VSTLIIYHQHSQSSANSRQVDRRKESPTEFSTS
jgi:hypothetical protein